MKFTKYDLNIKGFDMNNNEYEVILKDINNGNISNYDNSIQAYNKVRDSNLFDEDFYINHYNLKIPKKYALIHYLKEGFLEGKNPSMEFDGNEYLKSNPDVKRSNFNPLAHYVLYGKGEGRDFPFSVTRKLQNKIDSLENEIYINRITQNISLLRDKVLKGKKVNVVFILPAMMFVYKELYNLFDNDDKFNVQIVLVPHRIGNRSDIDDVAKDKYYQILGYLKENKYNVIEGYDFSNFNPIDLELRCSPDIIFYVLPYMRIYPENMKVYNLPGDILYAYIPYGEFLESTLEDNLYNFGWNERIWKIFCSSPDYLKNAAIKSNVGSSNVVVSGSARMDSLVNYEPSKYDYNWIFNKDENKKRIIWAPHHTLSRPGLNESEIFSTFDENYKFFYEFAKDNPNIEWVVRPHPLLKEVLSNVNTNMKIDGVITEDFADDYFFKWNSLPNARVHEELDYFDLFATADAMITDCVSFKSEYLFANKPGLILERNNVIYDDYKSSIFDAWYKAKGNDFDKIEQFINEVVVNGDDYLKETREKIFKEKLDFNTGNASKTIYEYIKNELFD